MQNCNYNNLLTNYAIFGLKKNSNTIYGRWNSLGFMLVKKQETRSVKRASAQFYESKVQTCNSV